ncbi:MAG: hypothetical protein H7Y08_07730 [Rhizobiaceae bacterium]|nr:hypothetical protein [Rhizobiaceae bacterium]
MFLPANIDTDDDQLEAFYIHHLEALSAIAISEFHLPNDTAADLAHDVLVAALWQSPRITDVDIWLRRAIADSARKYVRTSE